MPRSEGFASLELLTAVSSSELSMSCWATCSYGTAGFHALTPRRGTTALVSRRHLDQTIIG